MEESAVRFLRGLRCECWLWPAGLRLYDEVDMIWPQRDAGGIEKVETLDAQVLYANIEWELAQLDWPYQTILK